MQKYLFIFFIVISSLNSSPFIAMQKACDNQVATACYEFALLYDEGIGVQKDTDKAQSYYVQACDYGYTKSLSTDRSQAFMKLFFFLLLSSYLSH
ncbi:MAG: hypothetical protein Q9M36_08200 [Sulfurovum sp.]|nr:hypothetical protein [Sulfurovum sp.]